MVRLSDGTEWIIWSHQCPPRSCVRKKREFEHHCIHTKQFIWKSFRKTKSLYLIWKSISNYCFDSIPFACFTIFHLWSPISRTTFTSMNPFAELNLPIFGPSPLSLFKRRPRNLYLFLFFCNLPFHTGFKKVSIGTAAVPIAITPPSANFH